MAQLQKSQAGGDLPAPLKLANEYQKRLQAGDTDGANQILMFAKAADRGLVTDASGSFQAAPGYAPAVAGIEGAKSGAKQQAEKNVDLRMNPQIKQRESESSAIGEASGKARGLMVKQVIQAPQTENILTEAETLLPYATSGGLATSTKNAAAYFGHATEGSKADERLKVLSSKLVANVPRMEGPQSDRDVVLYQEAAGDLANTNKPVEARIAALDTIRDLNKKYQGGLNSPQGGEVPLSTDKRLINGNTPIVKTQAQFDALPSGARYIEIINGKPTPASKP